MTDNWQRNVAILLPSYKQPSFTIVSVGKVIYCSRPVGSKLGQRASCQHVLRNCFSHPSCIALHIFECSNATCSLSICGLCTLCCALLTACFCISFLLQISIDTPKRRCYMANKLKTALSGRDETGDEVVGETRFYVRLPNSVDHVNHVTGEVR